MELKHVVRQADIIPTDVLAEKVTVIGAGAIGSFVVLQLAKMGLSDITVWDDDEVSDENMSNQFYRFRDVGRSKVGALCDIVKEFTGTDIAVRNERYDGSELAGIVVSAVDNMETRRQVMDACSYKTRLLVDPRMGAEHAMLFGMRPNDDAELASYKKTLYSDEEAVAERCTAKATIYTVNLLSGLAVKLVKDFLVDGLFFKRMTWDVRGGAMDAWRTDGTSPFRVVAVPTAPESLVNYEVGEQEIQYRVPFDGTYRVTAVDQTRREVTYSDAAEVRPETEDMPQPFEGVHAAMLREESRAFSRRIQAEMGRRGTLVAERFTAEEVNVNDAALPF